MFFCFVLFCFVFLSLLIDNPFWAEKLSNFLFSQRNEGYSLARCCIIQFFNMFKENSCRVWITRFPLLGTICLKWFQLLCQKESKDRIFKRRFYSLSIRWKFKRFNRPILVSNLIIGNLSITPNQTKQSNQKTKTKENKNKQAKSKEI